MNGATVIARRNKGSVQTLLLIIVSILVIVGALLYHREPDYNLFSTSKQYVAPNSNTVEKESEIASSTLKILIVGDMMLDRQVRNFMNEFGEDYPFIKITDFLRSYDVAVGNLEGPITNKASITANLKNKALTFTFDPSVAPLLKSVGFDILGLANNHARDFGYEGYLSTKEYLKKEGISFYGDYENNEELSYVHEIKGKKIAFLGFNEFSYKNFDKVVSEIKKLDPVADFIIITPHWGIEYEKFPSNFQKQWARTMIDAGADAIIGAHPHVVQTNEEYKGKKIYYSLGNFIFDQNFSSGTMNGLGVEITLENDQPTYKEIKFFIDYSQPRVIE